MNISPQLTTLLLNNAETILMLIQHDGNRLAEMADRSTDPRLKKALKQYADTRLDLAFHLEKAMRR